MKKITLAVLVLALSPTFTHSHPGRTDSSGCHTCRTNCAQWGLSTGQYHCHQSKGVTQPVEPVRSIKAEQKTVPAPEYAMPKTNTTKVEQKVTPAVEHAALKSNVSEEKVRLVDKLSDSESPKPKVERKNSWFINFLKLIFR